MSDYAHTFLEMVNHLVTKHPDIAVNVESIAAGARGRTPDEHKKMLAMEDWERRGFSAPSPHHIKQACVIRNGLADATWVETGTYLGDTTALLAGVGRQVYSIEPEPTLFAGARARFAATDNVEIIHALSERALPELLPRLQGDVCFWLDGHYSAGQTHLGPQVTPIVDELNSVAAHLGRLGRVVVMVDDIRMFDPTLPEGAGYPPLDTLVDWAREHRLAWHIEQDIFVARKG